MSSEKKAVIVPQEGSVCARMVQAAMQEEGSGESRSECLAGLIANNLKLDTSVAKLLTWEPDSLCDHRWELSAAAAAVVVRWAVQVYTANKSSGPNSPESLPPQLRDVDGGLRPYLEAMFERINSEFGEHAKVVVTQCLVVLGEAVSVPAWANQQPYLFEQAEELLKGIRFRCQNTAVFHAWGQFLASCSRAGFNWTPKRCETMLWRLDWRDNGALIALASIPAGKWTIPLPQLQQARLLSCRSNNRLRPYFYRFLGTLPLQMRSFFNTYLIEGLKDGKDDALQVLMACLKEGDPTILPTLADWLRSNRKSLDAKGWCRVAMLLAFSGEAAIPFLDLLKHGALRIARQIFTHKNQITICWYDSVEDDSGRTCSYSEVRTLLRHFFAKIARITEEQELVQEFLEMIVKELKEQERQSGEGKHPKQNTKTVTAEFCEIVLTTFRLGFDSQGRNTSCMSGLGEEFKYDFNSTQFQLGLVLFMEGIEEDWVRFMFYKALEEGHQEVRSKAWSLLEKRSPVFIAERASVVCTLLESQGVEFAPKVFALLQKIDCQGLNSSHREQLRTILMTTLACGQIDTAGDETEAKISRMLTKIAVAV